MFSGDPTTPWHNHKIGGLDISTPQNRRLSAAIWFEIWGSRIRAKKFPIFPGKLPKKFRFSELYRNYIFNHSLQNSLFLENRPLSNILHVQNRLGL